MGADETKGHGADPGHDATSSTRRAKSNEQELKRGNWKGNAGEHADLQATGRGGGKGTDMRFKGI
jgi:hypothetical protein